MPRRIDSWQTDKASLAPPADDLNARRDAGGLAATDERATCDCPDYRREQVCDHILMAAAVRMVRRMIDAHAESEKPH